MARTLNFAKRDKYIVFVVNCILKLASKDYQKALRGTYNYGFAAMLRDSREDREIPLKERDELVSKGIISVTEREK